MKIESIRVEYVDKMGDDLSVVNAARVSFAKQSNWEHNDLCEGPPVYTLQEKDARLISYLARHGHWSPFAHTALSLRVRAPIFVARQLVKHQVGLTWNEVSRRYVDDEPTFYFPEIWRARPEGSVKQGSGGEFRGYIFTEFTHGTERQQRGVDEGTEVVEEILEGVLGLYEAMIDAGIAPEQARMVLPQNTMTEWIWTGNVMSFSRVCKQRLDPHAQLETRLVAEQIKDIIQEHFPVSFNALMHETSSHS